MLDKIGDLLLTYGVLGVATLGLSIAVLRLFSLLASSWDQRLDDQKASQVTFALNTEALKELTRSNTQLAEAFAHLTDVVKEQRRTR